MVALAACLIDLWCLGDILVLYSLWLVGLRWFRFGVCLVFCTTVCLLVVLVWVG